MLFIKNNLVMLFLVLFSTVLFGQDIETIAKQKPVKINGGISLGSFFNTSLGGIGRLPQSGYSLSGRSTLSLYGISIPFSVQLNEQGTTFSKPFNRFGLTPKYKWIKLYLGWRNMEMSQFTLANATFYGAGIELTPWKLRMSAMTGRFKKATEPGDKNVIRPQFERKGFAFKLGVGGDKNFIDFIFFKASDDTLSLVANDSITTLIPAHENAVLGMKSKFGFFKNKLSFHIDGALSAFTLNTRYRFLPSDLHPILEKTSKIFAPNVSSQFNYAGEAGMTLRFKAFSVATVYRRVMPEYKSLGANYIIDDLEAITISPSFSMMKRKIVFTGSLGFQRNNLNDFRQKSGVKKIGSANITYNPSPKFGVNLSYANYTFNQQVIKDNIIGDSLLIDQINHNFNIVPRYTVISKKSVQNLILVLNYQILDDRNSFTEIYADNNLLLANLNYSYTSLKSKRSFRVGINYFNFISNVVDIKRLGLSVGLSQKLMKDKVAVNINGGYNLQEQLGITSYVYNGNLSLTYRITKLLGLTARAYAIHNKSNAVSRTDIRSQLGLSLKF